MDKREDLFAATPPLEAKNTLMSMAVTEGVGYRGNDRKGGNKLEFIDVRRAYFHARARRLVYVEVAGGGQRGRKMWEVNQGNVWHSRCGTKLGVRIRGVHGGHWFQEGSINATHFLA